PPASSTVKGYDRFLANYEATGVNQHTSFMIQVKQRRNALLPIGRLPRELTHLVFHFVLPHQRLGRPDCGELTRVIGLPIRYYLALFKIRQVSHCWDQDICSTPSFWTVMSSLFTKALQDLIWRRSGNMALDAVVARNGYCFWTNEEHTAQGWKEGETAYLEQVMERGVRELYMHVPKGGDPSRYITNVLHPRLAKLHISHYNFFSIASPLLAPQLTDLYLNNCSLPLDGLTKLQSLALHSTTCPTLVQLLQTLAASPLLEELQLTWVGDIHHTQPFDGDVPGEPLNMAYLDKVVLEHVPFDLVACLLDRLVAPARCRSFIDVNIKGSPNKPLLCQQAGRLCRSLGVTGKKLNFSLTIRCRFILVALGDKSRLCLRENEEEHDVGFSQSSKLVRLFLNEIDKPSLQDSIEESWVWADSVSQLVEEIDILDEFFPNLCSLRFEVDNGDFDAVVRALTETNPLAGGSHGWLLPKLSTLWVNLDDDDFACDGLIDVAIKRSQAAALPLSGVSPIVKLTLVHGNVQRESLARLDEMGITYHLDA
ncbi:hypothetical protein FRC01_013015, partial [Tulasnella sp. 417]